MRIEPDGVLKRLVRGMPAGTMGGTRRSDPIRERAAATPTIITPADTLGGGGWTDWAKVTFEGTGLSAESGQGLADHTSSNQVGWSFSIASDYSAVLTSKPGLYIAWMQMRWAGNATLGTEWVGTIDIQMDYAWGFSTKVPTTPGPGQRYMNSPVAVGGSSDGDGSVEVFWDRGTSSGTGAFAADVFIARVGDFASLGSIPVLS